MSINVEFSPAEEARIQAVAARSGVDPVEILKQLVAQHLPPAREEGDWRARLREWQEQDQIQLRPAAPAEELFARAAAQFQQLSESERAEEDRLWDELTVVFQDSSRVLQLNRGS